jgi:hypothetical protein
MVTHKEHLQAHEEDPKSDEDTKLVSISYRRNEADKAYIAPDVRLVVLERGVHVCCTSHHILSSSTTSDGT